MSPINFDRNASYGLQSEVLEKLQSIFGEALNPSSIHAGGQRARAVVEEARENLSKLIGLTKKERIVFTSGATEANNTALMSPFWKAFNRIDKDQSDAYDCVVTSIEHPSVLECSVRLETLGIKVGRLYPRRNGEFSAEDLAKIISPQTKLVSLMFANNETGQVLPLKSLALAAKDKNPRLLIHSDAVQALGKIDFSFSDLGVDLMSLSAHKIGGLTGAGALVYRKDIECVPLLVGGPQELRARAGTENVLGIASFGYAAELLLRKQNELREKLRENRERLQASLLQDTPGLSVNFPELPKLPNTLSLLVEGVRADDLIVALDLAGIYVSSGSACASGKPEPSHVLLAMGLTEDEARRSIRISVGAEHSAEEIDGAARTITQTIKKMRSAAKGESERRALRSASAAIELPPASEVN